MPKSIFASTTFWFGVLQVIMGVYGLVTGLMENTEAFTLITTGIGTIGLRLKTTQPVSIL